jgi:hypothetical protein
MPPIFDKSTPALPGIVERRGAERLARGRAALRLDVRTRRGDFGASGLGFLRAMVGSTGVAREAS